MKNSENSPLLQISNLSHAFGGVKAVSGVDLAAAPGAIHGLIGPNGAGKTTVFNLITGVYKADQGSILLKNESIHGLPSHAIIAKGISRTFQNIRLFKSMTVLDNIRTAGYCRLDYPLYSALLMTRRFRRMEDEMRHRAATILDKFGLAGRMHDQAAGLPYGMQRKIELARALLSAPSVLLLDEPGAGMNPSELDDLAELILWIRSEFSVAIVLIEHRMQLVMRLCEQVSVLNFGEMIFSGRPSDLSSDPAVVNAYFGEDHAHA
jgi:branched-chain amino acid transport system ATP-binding protein